MNLQQLRIIREAARCNYNLTEVANTLYTSQSGVSRYIKELEEELNVELFIRQGKRLVNMTEPGFELVIIAERILNDINNIRKLSTLFAHKDEGVLVIAGTNSVTRYVFPKIIKSFSAMFPKISIEIVQGSTDEINDMLLSGEADIGISSEDKNNPLIATYPFYHWSHSIIVPKDHSLAKQEKITLELLHKEPLITCRKEFFLPNSIDRAFSAVGLTPNITLDVQDPSAIKTYVELGLGVGIFMNRMFDPVRDKDLVQLDATHLFGSHTTSIGLKRFQLQRDYIWRFIQLCNQDLSLEYIKNNALCDPEQAKAPDYLI